MGLSKIYGISSKWSHYVVLAKPNYTTEQSVSHPVIAYCPSLAGIRRGWSQRGLLCLMKQKLSGQLKYWIECQLSLQLKLRIVWGRLDRRWHHTGLTATLFLGRLLTYIYIYIYIYIHSKASLNRLAMGPTVYGPFREMIDLGS